MQKAADCPIEGNIGLCVCISECKLNSMARSCEMQLQSYMIGNRKLSRGGSCGNPANATNRERCSTAEWSDMDVMYHILGGSMPSLKGLQGMVWPLLCCVMHVWLKENEVQCALIIDTDRPSCANHETFYGCWMVTLCLCLHLVREKWIRSLFRCFCMQFQVDTADALAEQLHVCMD